MIEFLYIRKGDEYLMARRKCGRCKGTGILINTFGVEAECPNCCGTGLYRGCDDDDDDPRNPFSFR